jgi:hypothetical protein
MLVFADNLGRKTAQSRALRHQLGEAGAKEVLRIRGDG